MYGPNNSQNMIIREVPYFLEIIKYMNFTSPFRSFSMQISAKPWHTSQMTPCKLILSLNFVLGTTRNKSLHRP